MSSVESPMSEFILAPGAFPFRGGLVPHALSRRQFLAAGAVAGLGATRFASLARSAPSATVSIARCGSYGADLLPALDRTFDQLGGLERLVKGRTVGIKLN